MSSTCVSVSSRGFAAGPAASQTHRCSSHGALSPWKPSSRRQCRQSLFLRAAGASEEKITTDDTVVSRPEVTAVEAPVAGAVKQTAETTPLGDAGNQLVSGIFKTIFSLKAAEQINGRAAQMGFLAALISELQTNQSVRDQLFITRSVGEGVFHKTINYPQGGFFLAVATVLFTVVGSVAPALRGEVKNGLNVDGQDFGPFKASSEMVNGRMAMIGLVFLYGLEGIMGTALF